MSAERREGTVYLVGAGPGDPELLTVRGQKLLRQADAVVHDALVNPDLLDEAPRSAERFDVGKRAGVRCLPQEEISGLLVRLARKHRVVVRLKGGDPFVFGRGGEEALTLRDAGIPFEVVPGVTSGVAALAYAGIPLTHRGLASSATFLTGHQVSPAKREDVPPPLPAPDEGTLVVFMGLNRIDAITRALIERGRPAGTPAAVVESGTYAHQRTVSGSLGDIAERTRAAGIAGPALIVVGEVVSLRDRIAWVPEEKGSFADPTSPAGGAPPVPRQIEARLAALLES